MKTTIAILAGLLISGTAAAQRIGIEAGVNLSNMTFRYDTPGDDESESGDYRTGLKIGLVLDYHLAPGFYFQPGIFYSQKGSEEFTNDPNVDLRVSYIEIPFNFLFKAGTGVTGRFFAGGGPYIGIATGGEWDIRGFGDRDLEIGDDNDDEIARLDAGLNLTAGYEFPMGIYLRANAAYGLANVFSEDRTDFLDALGFDDPALRNNTYSFTLGYFIGR